MSSTSYSSTHVEIEDVVCKHDTGKAALCVIDGVDVWVPASVIHDDSEVYKKGTSGSLIVANWWATRNGYSTD